MIIRRRKSRPAKVADALGKTAKGATKAAKATAAYKLVKSSTLGKAIPIAAAGAGIAAIVAVKALRGGGEPATA